MSDPLTDPLPPKTPENYWGQTICIRCADGWPVCANRRPDGTRYTHQETCRIYNFGVNFMCVCCTLIMEMEYGGNPYHVAA